MDARGGLGAFLRSRRARVLPEDVGLPSSGVRRVPGLRRVDLAQLAGVSVEYYTRLEQGRALHPSDSVLDAIASALRLGETERVHLHDLARARPRASRPRRPQRIRAEVQGLLNSLDRVPAFVLGRQMDVLAWNSLASALVVDFGALPPDRRNMPRLIFLDPGARQLFPDWTQVARETVAFLRLEAGRLPDDPRLASLVGELSMKSVEFRCWWASHEIREKTHGIKRFDHPVVGPLTLNYETVRLPDDAQTLVMYTAAAGSQSELSLQLLATWAQPALADHTLGHPNRVGPEALGATNG